MSNPVCLVSGSSSGIGAAIVDQFARNGYDVVVNYNSGRERGEAGAGWLAVNGALSLLLGLFILVDFPSSADWAIGLLVGIDFIFTGWVLIMISMAGKQAAREA